MNNHIKVTKFGAATFRSWGKSRRITIHYHKGVTVTQIYECGGIKGTMGRQRSLSGERLGPGGNPCESAFQDVGDPDHLTFLERKNPRQLQLEKGLPDDATDVERWTATLGAPFIRSTWLSLGERKPS